MENNLILLGIIFAATLVLFISNRVRLDLVAIMACLALAWLGLIRPLKAISGFASKVNALLMDPGGYTTRDYLRAGGVMTVLFISIATIFIYLFV